MSPRKFPISLARGKATPSADSLAVPGEGLVHCRFCGVAVEHATETLVADSIETGRGFVIEQRAETEVGVCDICRTRHEIAEVIVDGFPGVIRRVSPGDRGHAISVANGALTALDVLGVKLATPTTEREAYLLLTDLASVGAAAWWAAVVIPTQRPAARRPATRERFIHVGEEQRAAIQEQYLSHLQRRVDEPGWHPLTSNPGYEPGQPRGCGFCGVGLAKGTGFALRSWAIWGVERQMHLDQLGLTAWRMPVGSNKAVYAYLCPVCREAAERVGAMGRTALDEALLAFLDVHLPALVREDNPGKLPDDVAVGLNVYESPEGQQIKAIGVFVPRELDGVRAWVTLPGAATGEREPAAKPWEHIADLEGLRESLKKLN